jgi:outer membrane protein TolC
VPSYDPIFSGTLAWAHRDPNTTVLNPVNTLNPTDNTLANVGLADGFSSGLQLQVLVSNTTNILPSNQSWGQPFDLPNVQLVGVQPLLRGAGFNVNRRYIRIAENDLKVSRLAFRQQLVDLIYGVRRLYYDLVSLNEDVRVKQETLAAAQKLYEDDKAQVEVGTLAPLELSRVEALVSAAQMDLTRSEGLVRQQEAVLKSQISRRGSADPILQPSHIVPTDTIVVPQTEDIPAVPQLIERGLQNRADLAQAAIQ